jgi:spore maturation protein CgeB
MRNLPDLCEQVKSLLAHPASLRESGELAARAVLDAHTWRHRVSHVLGAMRMQ